MGGGHWVGGHGGGGHGRGGHGRGRGGEVERGGDGGECFNSSIAYELSQNNNIQVGEDADLDIPFEVEKIPGIYSLEES